MKKENNTQKKTTEKSEKQIKKPNNKKNAKITNYTKNLTIGEVLKSNPNLEEVFLGFGMHCISCPVSQMETIEEAAIVHGVDVEFLLKKINEFN